MKKLLLALIVLSFAAPAIAKDKAPPPPVPAVEPDWAAIRAQGEATLKQPLFDPGSAQIVWTEGFRWGYIKPSFSSKTYAWVACGTMNAKNRMGGYVGAHRFYVAVRTDGKVLVETELTFQASCFDGDPHVDPQAALLDAPAPAASVSIADELTKLATLRDKGVITPAEFDQQKAKLLSK